jgi:hypothetical protein
VNGELRLFRRDIDLYRRVLLKFSGSDRDAEWITGPLVYLYSSFQHLESELLLLLIGNIISYFVSIILASVF